MDESELPDKENLLDMLNDEDKTFKVKPAVKENEASRLAKANLDAFKGPLVIVLIDPATLGLRRTSAVAKWPTYQYNWKNKPASQEQVSDVMREFGKKGASKGGIARALALSPRRRRQIAVGAIKARWRKKAAQAFASKGGRTKWSKVKSKKTRTKMMRRVARARWSRRK